MTTSTRIPSGYKCMTATRGYIKKSVYSHVDAGGVQGFKGQLGWTRLVVDKGLCRM